MNSFINQTRSVLGVSLAAMLATAALAGAAAAGPFNEHELLRPAFPAIDLGARQSRGQDAVDRLGTHLTDVAAWYGKSADALRKEILSDRRLRIDQTGRILFVEDLDEPLRPEAMPASLSGPIDGALASLDQTFYLHSHPGANRTIYLDFNGATITGTAWNSGGNTITAVPFDIDGNPAAFSDSELQRIQYIWQRVAEDYAPFDVDVTTQPPSQDKITRSDANDQVFGTTVVITKTTGVYSCSCGGIAYVGVFNYSGGSHPPDFYKPAFAFYDMLGSGNEKAVAEAIAHEAGHNMGLHHDGTSAGDTYYAGQGNDPVTGWAPIMGVGYYRPLVQFSKGEYTGANNKEDDFVVAQDFGLPLRLDDYGSDTRTATPFVQSIANGQVSGSMDGVIETASDKDVFAIAAGVGTLHASVVPANRSPDVDVLLNLLDANGKVLATVNPLNALNATLTYDVAAQGTYYLQVRGTGQGDALATGYSNYGSVGNFRLSASFVAPTGTPPTAVIAASTSNGPAPLSVLLDGRGSHDDGRVAFWYWDFGDGNSDVTGSLSAPSHVYQVAGNYLARLTVVDDTGLSASTSRVINVTTPGPMASVQSILITAKQNSKSYAWAVANVTVVDQLGRPLRNARVSANWNGVANKAVTVSTNQDGRATLTSPKTMASGCFNLYISNVAITAYPFNGASQRSAQVCR